MALNAVAARHHERKAASREVITMANGLCRGNTVGIIRAKVCHMQGKIVEVRTRDPLRARATRPRMIRGWSVIRGVKRGRRRIGREMVRRVLAVLGK
jgi:hypothetical protein